MLYPLSYRGAGRETRSASLAGTPQESVCRGWLTVTPPPETADAGRTYNKGALEF